MLGFWKACGGELAISLLCIKILKLRTLELLSCFENGAIAAHLGTSLSEPPKPTKIEVCSEKGRLELTRFRNYPFRRWRGCPHFASQRPSNRWLDFSGAIEGFANWILHDTPYLCSVEQSIPVLSVVFGIYESSLQEKKSN